MFKAIRDAFSAFRRQGQVRRRRNGLAGVPSLGTCHRAPRAPRDPRQRTERPTCLPHSNPTPATGIRADTTQRAAMQQQLETFQAESAAQLKASEEQTLEVLNGPWSSSRRSGEHEDRSGAGARAGVAHRAGPAGTAQRKDAGEDGSAQGAGAEGRVQPHDPKLGGGTREPRTPDGVDDAAKQQLFSHQKSFVT